MQKKIKKEFNNHKVSYILLGLVFLFATFLRVYRAGQILGFYYDQGRDALEIWDLIHKGDFFLIGPTTGIFGIFRGPFYYYLITPLYWLSQGNPVLPANFLSFTTVLAIGLLFYLVLRAHSRAAAFFAAIIGSFSFKLIFDARWLSNPTPMMLLSTLLMLCMFLIIDGKKKAWIPLSFVAGLSLFHFGSSGEFFYFPALLIFTLWQRRSLTLKIIIFSILAFMATALPLVLFDLKNNFLLWNNVKAFLFEKGSFKESFWVVLPQRLDFYRLSLSSRIFQNQETPILVILFCLLVCFLYYLPRLLREKKTRAVFLLFMSPIIGLLFFQGNEGNIYDYYLTGYYFVFLFLVAITFGELWKNKVGKVLIVFFFGVFLYQNLRLTFIKLGDNATGPESIILKNQLQAIGWIYDDAKGNAFNTDFYVPPVIPYAYDYLFTWYPTTSEIKSTGSHQVKELIPLLYTLSEVDPPHPERLREWQERQAGIGQVEYSKSFGGITVERRARLK